MINRIRGPLSRTLLAGASAIAIAVSTPALAQDATRSFDIPAQPLSSALLAYSRQADTPVIASMDLLKGKTAPAVQGDLPQQVALTMLLDGSGLRAVQGGSGGLVVERVAADPQSGSAAGDGADGTVDTLVVTAQKREEDIQDVPIAISAFTQEDLTRSQVAGGPDLITQVPNMTFTKTNFSSYSIQLRGIGTQAISATTDPAVAVAFNNTPFIRNRFFEQEFYDLQRVEVLRGPQGTLYGRNATAGVVNIISQKPKFQFEAKASADVSNFNSSRIEGMVNIPLVEDQVALRLAGAWTKRDGYATNELTGNPIDGRDLWSTRVSLRIAPTDRIDANLIWEHFEEDDDRLRSGKQLCNTHTVTSMGSQPIVGDGAWVNAGNDTGGWSRPQGLFSQGCERDSLYSEESFQTPNGNMLPYYMPLGSIGLPIALGNPYENTFQSQDLRVIESAVDPGYKAKADLFEMQVSFDLSDNLTLSSESSYNTDFIYSTQDFNRFNTAAGAWAVSNGPDPYDPTDQPSHAFLQNVLDENGVFCDPQLGCSNRLVAVDLSTAKSRQFSQEFRLSSSFEGAFNFSLGANYLRYDTEDKYYVFINSLSLIAASGTSFAGYDPYIPGVSDNADCMFNGYEYGDPTDVYGVTGCVYLDPNPIERVNDQGHNYFLSRNPYKLISYAVFGESYYQITDNLKVTAGLRWTVDKKDAPRIPSWLLASRTIGYPVAEVVEQEWREPTGRVAIDWKPDLGFTDETLLYASYAHGYKAGGANPPGYIRVFYVDPVQAAGSTLESETRPKTFDPEFVDAFELGSKNTLLDGSVTLNLAAFYYDYKDYQISEIVDRSAFNRNLDATVWGLELEADWRPLENLRFGFKTGYEETKIGDGQSAVDLMDRTAGDPEWTIVRPFPTYASSCILPTRLFDRPTGLYQLGGGIGGGNPGPCEIAYGEGVDPVTQQPYQPGVVFPNVPGFTAQDPYTGFDPSAAPNNGEGISKQLGGNELPNAPNLTATITADYTIPLPNEWLATLHTDLHWQGESDWRIFQDHDYSKLDEYFTMNLAAIFVNEEHGWNIMAYIKNVTDETAITGAFLNSDDTGLTTNVFLTEPRLYGLRVTKNWSGGSLLGSFGARREGPFPWTVELGGDVQRHDAPSTPIEPEYADVFTGPLDVLASAQAKDLDWGDGRSVKVTYRPEGLWMVSAGVRFGRTNGGGNTLGEQPTDPACAYPDAYTCEYLKNHPLLSHLYDFSEENRAEVNVHDREDHLQAEFMVGRDVGLGSLSRSTLSVGLAYAKFNSDTDLSLRGVPDWYIADGFYFYQLNLTHTVYDARVRARRESEGWGPVISWDAAMTLMDGDWGGVDLDWSLGGGVLFGDRKVDITGSGDTNYFEVTPFEVANRDAISTLPHPLVTTLLPAVGESRSSDVTIPTFNASLGLSYEVGAFKVGAGYRWERHFDAIDGGFDEEADADRTIDGPYFKIALGFGG